MKTQQFSNEVKRNKTLLCCRLPFYFCTNIYLLNKIIFFVTREIMYCSFSRNERKYFFVSIAKAFFNYRDETRLLLPLLIMETTFVCSRERERERERERSKEKNLFLCSNPSIPFSIYKT